MDGNNMMNVKQKTIDDFITVNNKHYICSKCKTRFTFPLQQKEGTMCPFCQIGLESTQPPVFESEREINEVRKINLIAIKDNKGNIIDIREVGDEKYSEIVANPVSNREIERGRIIIIPKIENCAITKILDDIVNEFLKTDIVSQFNITYTKSLIDDEESKRYLNKDDGFFPQVALILKFKDIEEESITHIPIKNFNIDLLTNTILELKTTF